MASLRPGRTRRRPGFHRLYGESPVHLLVLCASFAVCGYAAVGLLSGDWPGVVLWFVGAAVLHDLVLLPLYTATDRLLCTVLRGRRPAPGTALNHVRVPAFLSLLLLAVYWPLVLRQAPHFRLSTGLSPDVFLGSWLLITAALFALSALWLAVRMVRDGARARRRAADRAGR
ncbi:hypothetical protein [Streptomyces sp. NBC_01497]|uniref:hypothetical protein n=1 Tax=Streptomyces sp. NBC_01497 TaxID=2903885 RepID=UPI002E35BA52|nr:hypothetical protein [Streptomyces sp. NBC_01497]